MPRDAVSRTANVERNGGHKWVNGCRFSNMRLGTHIYLVEGCQGYPPRRDKENSRLRAAAMGNCNNWNFSATPLLIVR